MKTETISTTGATEIAFEATVDRKRFSKALDFQAKCIVEARNTIPVLSCVLLEGTLSGVVVHGTDLDIQAAYTVNGTSGIGRACVPLKALQAAVAVSEGDTVRIIAHVGGRLELEADGVRHQIVQEKAEDFPMLKPAVESVDFEIPSDQLQEDFDRIQHCVSNEESRYYLNGINVHTIAGPNGPEGLAFAATDGHRLGVVNRPLPADLEGSKGFSALVHKKTVKAVLEALKLIDGTAGVRFGGNSAKGVPGPVEFDLGPVFIRAKLIDGTFPDYTRIIPSYGTNVLEADAKALTVAAKKGVKLGAAMGAKTKSLRIEHQGAKLSMTISSPEGLASTIDVDATGTLGGQTVGLNAAYLAAIADTLQGPVSMTFADPAAPVLFKSESAPELRYVLMPMRV